jgi:hypothetical protein
MLNVMLLVAASASVSQLAQDQAKPVCQNMAPQLAKEGRPARLQRLNELPNANMALSVVRTENGCSKPAVVRYDIGSAPKRR